LADGQFYGEEFGKQYSMMGEMFLWCRGVERLGLNELVYGFTGKGARRCAVTSRASSPLAIAGGDPGGLPHYPQITMGDGTQLRI